MIEEIVQFVKDFLDKFIGMPTTGSYGEWSWEYIIRCEAVHFGFSAYSGVLAWWISTTFLSKRFNKDDRFTYLTSLLFGAAISISVHVGIDGLTSLA